eukprot:jgi/Picsp_1/4539/NSC_06760-R1_homocysteine-induced endoplasmic reticulum isoform a
MEGASKDRQGGPLGVVSVILKNPTRVQQEGFKLEVTRATTLKDLKKEISMMYPGRPKPSDVTLVYAGKLLREDSMDIESIVGSGREIGTVTMHIVVREYRPDAFVGDFDPQGIDRSKNNGESTAEISNKGPFFAEETSSLEVEMEAEVGKEDSDVLAGHSGSGLNSHAVEESQAKDTHVSHLTSDDTSFRSQDYVYLSVFSAAYQAAVQALISSSQVKKTEENASTLAFLPTVIPLPQPAFPSTIPNHPWQGNSQGQYKSVGSHKQQQKKPLLVPVMTLPISPSPTHYQSSCSWKNGSRRRRIDGQDQAETTEHVLRLLRELRGQQEQSDRIGTENTNEVQPNDQGRNNARRRQVQIRIHINMRVLLQVAVLLIIVYQHCPPGRFLTLCLIGFVFYLSSTRIGKVILHRVLQHFHAHRMENNRQRADGQGNNNVEQGDDGHFRRHPVAPAPREQGDQNIARQQPGAGLIQEMQAFIAGFITSLLPAAADNGARQGNNNNMQQQGMQMRDVFGANNGNRG